MSSDLQLELTSVISQVQHVGLMAQSTVPDMFWIPANRRGRLTTP